MSVSMPSTCGVCLKEWFGVRDALLSGEQTILLRKGGIAEGPRGFVPEHQAFWILPTQVHQASQGLKRESTETSSTSTSRPGQIALDALLVLEGLARIEDPCVLDALAPEHVWTGETIAARFRYRIPGLWLMLCRTHRSQITHRLEERPEYAGCTSWVKLDSAVDCSDAQPVLSAGAFESRRERIERAIGARLLRPPFASDNGGLACEGS